MVSEIEEEVGGGWTALLGLGLAPTLSTPLYLAKIANRFARRAASTSSTGGGDGGKSNSMSTGSGFGGEGGRDGGLVGWATDVPGLWRGDILKGKKKNEFRGLDLPIYWSYDTHSPSSFSSLSSVGRACPFVW